MHIYKLKIIENQIIVLSRRLDSVVQWSVCSGSRRKVAGSYPTRWPKDANFREFLLPHRLWRSTERNLEKSFGKLLCAPIVFACTKGFGGPGLVLVSKKKYFNFFDVKICAIPNGGSMRIGQHDTCS